MSSISQLEQMLRSIRTQALPAVREGQPRPVRAAEDPKTTNQQVQPGAAAFVAGRVRAIQPDDPQRRRRAFRVFLEGTLLNLFGPDAMLDPAFLAMVEQVQDAMQANASLATPIERLIDHLLSTATNGKALADLEAAFASRPDKNA